MIGCLLAGRLKASSRPQTILSVFELFAEDPYPAPDVVMQRLGADAPLATSMLGFVAVPAVLHDALVGRSSPLSSAELAEVAALVPGANELAWPLALETVANTWLSVCVRALARQDRLPRCTRRGDFVVLRDDWMRQVYATLAEKSRAKQGLPGRSSNVELRGPTTLSWLPEGIPATLELVVLHALSQDVYATDAAILILASWNGHEFTEAEIGAARQRWLVQTSMPKAVIVELERVRNAGSKDYSAIVPPPTGVYADPALVHTMATRWIRICDFQPRACMAGIPAMFMSEVTARRYFARLLRAKSATGPVLQGMTRDERRDVFSAVIELLASAVPPPSLEALAECMQNRGFVLGQDELAAVYLKLTRLTIGDRGAADSRVEQGVVQLWVRVCSLDAANCVKGAGGQTALTPTGVQAMFRLLHQLRPSRNPADEYWF